MTRSNAVLVAAALAGAMAFAGPSEAGINARQRRQQERIAQGTRSGELTRREAARLEAEQRQIRREERVFRSDGRLSPWERADLNRDLNRASRDIARQRHDGQVR
jgi:hypothetical protein